MLRQRLNQFLCNVKEMELAREALRMIFIPILPSTIRRLTHLPLPVIPHIQRNRNTLQTLLPSITSIPMQNLMRNCLRHQIRPRPHMRQVQNSNLHARLPRQFVESVYVYFYAADHEFSLAGTGRAIRERESRFHF
jgi:hypothetical protein